MPWPTISDIESQCRIESEDAAEDALLTMYLQAAQDHITQRLNRNLYELTTEIPLDADLLPINPTDLALDTNAGNSIRLACLLLIGHWYENRESTSTFTIKEVPMAFNALLEPYRVIDI